MPIYFGEKVSDLWRRSQGFALPATFFSKMELSFITVFSEFLACAFLLSKETQGIVYYRLAIHVFFPHPPLELDTVLKNEPESYKINLKSGSGQVPGYSS